MAGALLALVLGVAWFFRRDGENHRGFERLLDTRDRQRRYRAWIGRAWLAFGVLSVVALALLGRLAAVLRMPDELVPRWLSGLGDPDQAGDLAIGLLAGVAIGMGLLVLIHLRRRRTGVAGHERPPLMVGNVAAMLPRNRTEIGYGAALSLTAGIVEELFFRLLLPLLIAMLSGSALLGFGVALLIFGAMHRYQGWIGVIASLVIGALLTGLYVASGALWLAIALHALIDLSGLVLRPLLTGAWRLSASAASPS